MENEQNGMAEPHAAVDILSAIRAVLEENAHLRLDAKAWEITASEGGWRCPQCGNRFSFADGVRYLTRTSLCTCPAMPESIRKLRQARADRLKTHGGPISDPTGTHCKMCSGLLTKVPSAVCLGGAYWRCGRCQLTDWPIGVAQVGSGDPPREITVEQFNECESREGPATRIYRVTQLHGGHLNLTHKQAHELAVGLRFAGIES